MNFKYIYSKTIPTPSGFLGRNITKTEKPHKKARLNKSHYILWNITALNPKKPEIRYLYAHLYHNDSIKPIGYMEAQILPAQQLFQNTEELYWLCDPINESLSDVATHLGTSNIDLYELTDGGNILNFDHIEILPSHQNQQLGKSLIHWLLKFTRNHCECTVAIIKPFPIQYNKTRYYQLPDSTFPSQQPALKDKCPVTKTQFTQAHRSIIQYYVDHFAATPLGKVRAGYYKIDTSISITFNKQ